MGQIRPCWAGVPSTKPPRNCGGRRRQRRGALRSNSQRLSKGFIKGSLGTIMGCRRRGSPFQARLSYIQEHQVGNKPRSKGSHARKVAWEAASVFTFLLGGFGGVGMAPAAAVSSTVST